MKIKDGFALRNFADKWIAVSINDNTHENNLFITLNNSGAFVWNLLQNETQQLHKQIPIQLQNHIR